MMDQSISLAFTQNSDVYSIIERIAQGGTTKTKYHVYNPENCMLAHKEANLSIAQLRIIRPKLDIAATASKGDLEDADIIIIPGLFLPSKTDDQFAAISQQTIRNTFDGLTLKEECAFFICGSFRALIVANHLGDILEDHRKNIQVIDPYVYAGMRLFDSEKAGDPVLYPNKDSIFTVINPQQIDDDDDKEKVKALREKDGGRAPELLAIEREALGHALQLFLQSNTSFALIGKFPTGDEQTLYNIANFPVILPSDPKSSLAPEIKIAVKKLADQISSVLPEDSQSESE